MSYDSALAWHCGCGASGPSTCRCRDLGVREALYSRLRAQGVEFDRGRPPLSLERLAALLVVLEDPFWAESPSVMQQDADYMITMIREGEGRPRT